MVKILIFMGGYFPGQNYGGPPVSIDNFCTLFCNKFDIYIVTSDHDQGSKIGYGFDENWVKRNNCKVKYIADKKWSIRNIRNIIKEIKPNVVYLQSIFRSFTPKCLYVAKQYRIPILLAPRGELCMGALNIKKYKKIPYLKALTLLGLTSGVFFQSTSEDEKCGIKKYFSGNDIFDLKNIPSLPSQKYNYKIKSKGTARFIFVSRIVWKKNLDAAISFFLNMNCEKIIFDIYGAIEDEAYWKHCLSIIKKIPSNISINYKGVVPHNNIHEVLSNYDALLFPTLSENYGHVIAEALGVGCPVVISDQTPWNDVNNYKAGFAIPLTETNLFITAIKKFVFMDNDSMMQYRYNAIKIFKDKLEIDSLNINYIKAFNILCNEDLKK